MKKLIKPVLGAGTLFSLRGGFLELRDEKRSPAPTWVCLKSIDYFSFPTGLSPFDILFALKPKAPI